MLNTNCHVKKMAIKTRHRAQGWEMFKKKKFFLFLSETTEIIWPNMSWMIPWGYCVYWKSNMATTIRSNVNKGNNKITEHRAIFLPKGKSKLINQQTKAVNNRKTGKNTSFVAKCFEINFSNHWYLKVNMTWLMVS